jgi:hypothetical protein
MKRGLLPATGVSLRTEPVVVVPYRRESDAIGLFELSRGTDGLAPAQNQMISMDPHIHASGQLTVFQEL